ncbi:MAG: helix-turn-helix transcriptional regulator [Phenylobacterium sp.]|uniref:helix-turn-helix domain-containing protein n=1 Tax=Phenylobacterium sp. TaxID=1871053 RepID=UPI001A4933B9|nr:helix-turn-helix transcriptional regulator [Phenylobacterium sp.]MBL8770570.1 helix-turn-helix transcriptional regulator [Phenylobacterium sp.]
MESFTAKLGLTLKALSLSRGRLAAALGVDKSVVGRWVTGAVQPSDHNLLRLTALVAEQAPGFTLLDWDLPLPDFAQRLGVRPEAAARLDLAEAGLTLALMGQVRSTTALRGAAYEGFFRSTRPYLLMPGRFLHDYGMIRLDEHGLLSLKMGTGGHCAEGWMLLLQNQLFSIVADTVSGAFVFGIFNGVASAKAEVVDGLMLGAALDPGRTPTATAMMFERIGDLSGDREADDACFAELMRREPVAPEGSVPEALRAHLVRDLGPTPFAAGGDLLLRMPLDRSMARGAAYREPSAI